MKQTILTNLCIMTFLQHHLLINEAIGIKNRLNGAFSSHRIQDMSATYEKSKWRRVPQIQIYSASPETGNIPQHEEMDLPMTSELEKNNQNTADTTQKVSSDLKFASSDSTSFGRMVSHLKMSGTDLVKSGGYFTLSFAEGAGQILDTVTVTGTSTMKSLYDLKRSLCNTIFSGFGRLAVAIDESVRKGFEFADSTIDYCEKYGRDILNRVEARLN